MNQFDTHTYIAFNKPKGVICTTEKIPGNIIDAVGSDKKLLPVGRLDKDSEGLILLTDNAAIINRIIHPDFKHEKEYLVTLNLPLRNLFLKQMATGIDLGDAVTKPCRIRAEPGTKRIFRIVLTQGLNRQIRRMCAIYDYQVIRLQRVRIMHIRLGNLKEGQWRELNNEELERLFAECYK